MFGRRHQLPLSQKIRSWLWPKRGFKRAWRYLVARLSRLKTTPHAIAAGFASGAAVSFTPLLGLHFVLAFVAAFITRGSMIAAALGTVVGNPITFPFIFAATYWIGARLREFVSAPPGDAFDAVLEGMDTGEVEAEIAADVVLETAGSLIEEGWSFTDIGLIWPTMATMLIGATLLAPLAWGLFYVLVRSAVVAFQRQRAAAAARRAQRR